jgi:protein phosphatase 1L
MFLFQAFFGVFDGHSGRMAADFAAENMGQNIVDAMLSMGDEKEDIVEQAVRAGYLTTDAEFLKQVSLRSQFFGSYASCLQ